MRFVTAWLCLLSASAFTATALAFCLGGLSSEIAFVSLAIGAVTGVASLWSGRHRPMCWSKPGFWGWFSIVAFALFSARAFLWLIFRDHQAIHVLSPNNLGDMSLHLTYIEHLANGVPFWPDNPIHTGSKLTYPIGIDLFNSLLTLVGVDTIRGVIWVGLIGCICTGRALWRWGGAFVLAGFLFNGGTFGYEWFKQGYETGVWQCRDFQADVAWKSIPLALFVTQRGFLYALPAGLLLMASWRARFFERREDGWQLPGWVEALLYAAVPLFHLHTFLFLSALLACWAVCARARKHLALIVAVAFLPATAAVLFATDFFNGPSLLGWKPGWMQEEPGVLGFVTFWLTNFGLLPFLVAALLGYLVIRFVRDRSVWPAPLVLPALGIFLVCCVVKFAPWEWDNTKLMIWSYLAVLPAIWTVVLARWPAPLRGVACFLLFFSGFISLFGGLDGSHRGYSIAQRAELDGMTVPLRSVPATERFLTASTGTSYSHPILLHGRKVALGYVGHVWSHGYEHAMLQKDIDAALDGDPRWRKRAERLGCRYLFWGREERESHPDSSQPWRTTTRLVAFGEWGEIYDLEAPPKRIIAPQDDSPTTAPPADQSAPE